MANGYYGDRAVKLPNMYQAPGQALAGRLDDISRQNERMYEIQYKEDKDREAENWRKLNLIQDLTDISKYQTGSDVADAIGGRKMGEIFQKYTESAGSMSPAELQANIQKDMGGLINGMNAAKQELTQADEQLKVLKQKYPSIDVSRLGSDYRSEILGRRIENNDFKNPLLVGQSEFDVLNPDFLSKYTTGNKNLSNAIINPQGVDMMKVFRGSPSQYTEYTAKVPFWKKENFDRSKVVNGFYNAGEPKLDIKAKAIPGVQSVNGQPFMAIDEDVYKRFSEDESLNLELTAATRQKFKDYDSFSPEEKSLAKRNVLYDKVKELDQSNYYPSDIKSPPRTRISLSTNKTQPIDLREYPDVPGGKDITSLMQGVNVSSLITGKAFAAEKVVYNPDTQDITIVEAGSDKPETMSLTTFLQNIRPQNPAADIKWLREGLSSPIPLQKNIGATKMKPNGYSNITSGTYKGKTITIGQRGDKWYNTETGEELK